MAEARRLGLGEFGLGALRWTAEAGAIQIAPFVAWHRSPGHPRRMLPTPGAGPFRVPPNERPCHVHTNL